MAQSQQSVRHMQEVHFPGSGFDSLGNMQGLPKAEGTQKEGNLER